jgi:hypothetical protein
MLAHIEPSSAMAIGILIVCLILVFGFEATNGFHDTANAVATIIYTNALRPTQAEVWSGIMNFIGVLVGGIAVAYALVELLPPDVLSSPDGSPAVTMLVALFIAAGFWNIATWWFGIDAHPACVGTDVAGDHRDCSRVVLCVGRLTHAIEIVTMRAGLNRVGRELQRFR